MAVVELLLPALPAHVRTARLVVVAAARRAGLADELVDEVRLAVGEACARAVGMHARHVPGVLLGLFAKNLAKNQFYSGLKQPLGQTMECLNHS